MSVNEELQQQLWELVYDLLSPAEAKDLIGRIKSDPELARAYAEVVLKSESLAAAARVSAPAETWRPEDSMEPVRLASMERLEPAEPKPETPPAGSPFRPRSRPFASWVVGLAASLLLCLVGYSSFATWQEARAVPGPQVVAVSSPVVTRVVAPAGLEPGITNWFDVTSQGLDGKPRRAAVEYTFRDALRRPVYPGSGVTNDDGVVRISLPAQYSNEVTNLVIRNHSAPISPILEVPLATKAVEHVAQVSTDRLSFLPGDELLYRAVILRRLNFQVDREFRVQFEVRDPQQQVVAESLLVGSTESGVAAGAWKIPADAPTGKYVLAVSSLEQLFPPAVQEFFVWKQTPAPLQTQLELARDSYSPGDEVVAHFGARAGKQPVAGARVTYQMALGGQVISAGESVTNSLGNSLLRIPLPATPANADAKLAAAVEYEGQRGSAVTSVSLAPRQLEVQFFPEGGRLVADLPSRIYYRATTAEQQPAYVAGRVLTSANEVVAEFSTIHEGRGVFSLQPKAGENYHFEWEQPADRPIEATFPTVEVEPELSLSIPQAYVAAGQDLNLELYSRNKRKNVSVQVLCRGSVVGNTTALVDSGSQSTQVAVPLVEEASGVLRATAFDMDRGSPQPVAERLVFRQPSRKLQVDVVNPPPEIVAGQAQALALYAKNERGEGTQAVLGVSVVSDSATRFRNIRQSRFDTDLLLKGDLEHPEELEDADFYLSDQPETAQALDLLLATEGWRRLEVAKDSLAFTERESVPNMMGDLGDRVTPIAASEIPLMIDNRDQIAQQLASNSISLYRDRRPQLQPWVLPVSGACLMTLVLILVLAEQVPVRRVALPAAVVSILAILIGLFAWRSVGGKGAAASIGGSAPSEIVWRDEAAPTSNRATESSFEKKPAVPESAAAAHDPGATRGLALPESERPGQVGETRAGAAFQERPASGTRLAPATEAESVPKLANAPLPRSEPLSDAPAPLAGASASNPPGTAPKAPAEPADATPAPAPVASPALVHSPATRSAMPPSPKRAPSGEGAGGFAGGLGGGAGVPAPPGLAGRASGGQVADAEMLEQKSGLERRRNAPSLGASMDRVEVKPKTLEKAEEKLNTDKLYAEDQFRLPEQNASPNDASEEFGRASRDRRASENEFVKKDQDLRPLKEGGATDSKSPRRWMRYYATRAKDTDAAHRSATRLWQPRLITDRQGHTQVDFTLGRDELYQLRVHAHGDGRIGSTTHPLVTMQTLAVETGLPEQLSVGDVANGRVIVQQSSDRNTQLSVTAEADESLAIEGAKKQTLPLTARGQAQAEFRYLARRPEANLSQRVTAQVDDQVESVEQTISIEALGYLDSQSFTGTLEKQATHEIELPESLVSDSVRLRVSVLPTPVAEWYFMVANVEQRKLAEWDPEAAETVGLFVTQALDNAGFADPELARMVRPLLTGASAKSSSHTLSDFTAIRGIRPLFFLWDRPQATPANPTAATLPDSENELTVRLADADLVRRTYRSDDPRPVEIVALGDWHAGKNLLQIDCDHPAPTPYVVDINYRTEKMPSADGPVEVAVHWSTAQVRIGELVPLRLELKNRTSEPLAQVQVVLGLPAGVDVPLEQLEQFRRDGRLSAFDLRGRELWLTWKTLASPAAPGSTESWPLDLLAMYAGEYSAPPTRVYVNGDLGKPVAWSTPFRLTIE